MPADKEPQFFSDERAWRAARLVRVAVRRRPGRAPHGRGLGRVRRPAHRRRGGAPAGRHPARGGAGLPAPRPRDQAALALPARGAPRPRDQAAGRGGLPARQRLRRPQQLRRGAAPWLAAAAERLLVVVSEELFADESTWPAPRPPRPAARAPARRQAQQHRGQGGVLARDAPAVGLRPGGVREPARARDLRARSAVWRGGRCSATPPGSHRCPTRRTSPCRRRRRSAWRRRWPRPSGCSGGRSRTPWRPGTDHDRHGLVPGRLGRPRAGHRGRAGAPGGHHPRASPTVRASGGCPSPGGRPRRGTRWPGRSTPAPPSSSASATTGRASPWSRTRPTRGIAVPPLVATSATVSPEAELGPGVVVMEHAHVGPWARLGAAVLVNTSAVVEHDGTVGAGTHLAPGSVMLGHASVGAGLPGGGAGDGAGGCARSATPRPSARGRWSRPACPAGRRTSACLLDRCRDPTA